MLHPWSTNDNVYYSPANVPFKKLRVESGYVLMLHREGWVWKVCVNEFANRWRNA
jgi:hypothetical protein